MDDAIKLLYRVRGLDVDECVGLIGPFDRFRIHTTIPATATDVTPQTSLEETLDTYLPAHSHVITIDHTSSPKPDTEELPFSRLYVSMVRAWCSIEKDKNVVGYLDTVHLHNAFPYFMSTHDLVDNFGATYERGIARVQEAVARQDPILIRQPVMECGFTRVYIHRDFYLQHITATEQRAAAAPNREENGGAKTRVAAFFRRFRA